MRSPLVPILLALALVAACGPVHVDVGVGWVTPAPAPTPTQAPPPSDGRLGIAVCIDRSEAMSPAVRAQAAAALAAQVQQLPIPGAGFDMHILELSQRSSQHEAHLLHLIRPRVEGPPAPPQTVTRRAEREAYRQQLAAHEQLVATARAEIGAQAARLAALPPEPVPGTPDAVACAGRAGTLLQPAARILIFVVDSSLAPAGLVEKANLDLRFTDLSVVMACNEDFSRCQAVQAEWARELRDHARAARYRFYDDALAALGGWGPAADALGDSRPVLPRLRRAPHPEAGGADRAADRVFVPAWGNGAGSVHG